MTSIEEGVQLREAGIRGRILIMAGFLRGDEEEILQHRLTPAVWEPWHLESLGKAARRRHLEVFVRGAMRRLWARISMDLILVDVTDVSGAQIGDEVILIGSCRDRSITASDHATLASTIPYEILCNISKRVPRFPPWNSHFQRSAATSLGCAESLVVGSP